MTLREYIIAFRNEHDSRGQRFDPAILHQKNYRESHKNGLPGNFLRYFENGKRSRAE